MYMRQTSNFRIGIASLVSTLSLTAYAAAGVSSGDSDTNSNQVAKLQEVVVTAEKRSENLQDVPSSVSALSGATLEAMGAESFTDYARSIPGLTFLDTGAGRQIPTIRGINPSTGAPAVTYYIDETPMPVNQYINGSPLSPQLIDIDRIEVLRGPQGTLYGSSSIGGTIKLIPNAPNLSKFEGYVTGEALVTQGEDGASPGGRSELVLNVPIMEDLLAVRGAFWYDNVGGFINRTWTNAGTGGIATGPVIGTVGNLPDEHTWGLRITALFQPSEQLSVSAMAYAQDRHFDGYTDITGGANNPNYQLVQSLIPDVPEPQENQFALYNLTVKYNFSRFNLISSTSYSDQSTSANMEGTSAIQLFPTFYGNPPSSVVVQSVAQARTEAYNFTQEARLATSQSIAGFDALVGVFYSKVYDPSRWTPWAPPQYNELMAGNDPASYLYAPDNILFASVGEHNERQTAEFGELTYHFTDALSLTGGLRHYDVSNNDYFPFSGWLVGGNVPGVVGYINDSSSANGFVYKGNLSYKVTPDHLLYAQYSEGFRPGFGQPALPPICNVSSGALEVKPDSIKSYELGAKTDWLERRLTVNAAAYRIDWKDIQQGYLLQCGTVLSSNFGSAVVKGAELEVNDRLTQRITAGLSGTYMSAELQQSNAATGALAGDQIEYVPNWQYAIYAQTTFPLLKADDGFARVDYQYTGSSYANYARLSDGSRDPESEVQVVHLLNLRTGMLYDAWEFALSGTNLLNRTVSQSLDPNANVTFAIPGRPRYVMLRPRMFSFSATYKF
jgi:iron complex outermembrane recepter protein